MMETININDAFNEIMNDIFDIVLNEHDRSLIRNFESLAEKLNGGEKDGVMYCVYILENLIEGRSNNKVENREKEVYFNEYCKKCKHKDISEAEDPCRDCLNDTTNEHSHKPTKFEERSNDIKRRPNG